MIRRATPCVAPRPPPTSRAAHRATIAPPAAPRVPPPPQRASSDSNQGYFDASFGKEGDEMMRARSKWLLHPSQPFKTCWDLLLATLVIYSIIVVPLRIGFEEDASSSSVICNRSQPRI